MYACILHAFIHTYITRARAWDRGAHAVDHFVAPTIIIKSNRALAALLANSVLAQVITFPGRILSTRTICTWLTALQAPCSHANLAIVTLCTRTGRPTGLEGGTHTWVAAGHCISAVLHGPIVAIPAAAIARIAGIGWRGAGDIGTDAVFHDRFGAVTARAILVCSTAPASKTTTAGGIVVERLVSNILVFGALAR